jgi:hypothetical protein
MRKSNVPVLLRLSPLVAVGLVLVALMWAGCSTDTPTAPSSQLSNQPYEPTTGLTLNNPEVKAIALVQEDHTPEFLALDGVVGTGVGMRDDGRLAMKILLRDDQLAGRLPRELEGLPVILEVVGEIKAFANHKVKQTPPIQLGTSGGWRYDLANGYCCGGTLGSLVQKGGVQYILSNYHVFESDIVSGGNGRVAQNGDPIIQPGLIDVACNAASAQNVGTLALQHSLPGSNVDCSLAQVISGMVSANGAILDVGTISHNTVGASLNQAVKKSGRTTALTRSTINGLNLTVSVAYENECAGGQSFVKTFTGQIQVRNRGSRFLAGGDSGSLMVEDITANPRAVGLLFAGSSSAAIANPIGQVLSFLGATMVGQ